MREIKFRAWDKTLGGAFWYWSAEDPQFNLAVEIRKGTPVMAYSGLKDKNGKEIYEGDVVQNKSLSMKGEIRFGTCSNSLGKYHGWCIFRKMKIGHDKISTWESPHWVVIGNIHENPELLK